MATRAPPLPPDQPKPPAQQPQPRAQPKPPAQQPQPRAQPKPPAQAPLQLQNRTLPLHPEEIPSTSEARHQAHRSSRP
ncbi:MAG: hypothetical protein GC205_05850 [Bacteroidetes bacterium]|nr:hypothetical protein [Bacteroidota bacterium]